MESIYLFSIKDLRLENNFSLFQAIKNSDKVIPVFIFDKEIFENQNINNYKKSFIYNSIKLLENQLKKYNSKLIIRYGKFLTELLNILNETKINNIYLNKNHENSEIKILSEEYNYKIFSYSDFEQLKKIRVQKFSKYKENFNLNYKINNKKYKITKLDHNIEIFSENLDNLKYSKFKNNIINLLSYKEIDNKIKNINIDNYEDLILYIDFGLISPTKILDKIKNNTNLESEILLDYLYFNEYKKIFNDFEIEGNYSEDFDIFVSLINSNTSITLINAISKAILNKRIISHYHLIIFTSFAINKNINALWIRNFLKNELINFDDNLFSAVLYNISNKKLKDNFYKLKNLDFIKKYLDYPNISDFFYINPYIIPVIIQKNIGFIIGKDFPEEKLKEEKFYIK